MKAVSFLSQLRARGPAGRSGISVETPTPYFCSEGLGTRLLVSLGLVLNTATFFLCCILLLAGGFVNPVQHGLDMIDDYDLVHILKSIENSPDDLYALEGVYPRSDVPLLAGKHCINTDQPYADLERWSAIDPEGKYKDVYNRLCHIAINLAEPGEETDFQEDGNYIILRLTREDLTALGVNYLITPRAFIDHASFIAEADKDNLYIWKLD